MPAQAKASSSVGTWTSLASGLSYEPFGAVKAMTLGNGLAVTNDWGAPGSASATGGGRLASRRLYRVADNASLSHLTYRHDADGNIASITDQVNTSGSVLYGYDKMGRLVMTTTDAARRARRATATPAGPTGLPR